MTEGTRVWVTRTCYYYQPDILMFVADSLTTALEELYRLGVPRGKGMMRVDSGYIIGIEEGVNFYKIEPITITRSEEHR